MERHEYQAHIVWLNRYQESLRREKIILLEIEQLRARSERITQVLTGMPAAQTQRPDTIFAFVACIIEQEQLLIKEVAQGHAIQKEIRTMIDGLEDPRMREILTLRYLCGRSWQSIADAMDLSDKWVRVLHFKALEGWSIV